MTNLNVITMNELSQENIDGFLPILIDVYNPDICWNPAEKDIYQQDNAHIRLICDDNKVVYKGKTYLPCSFNVQLPDSDGGKIGSASISITALDYRVRKILRSIRLGSELNILSVFEKKEKLEGSGKFIYKFVPIKSAKFSMNSASVNRTTATFNLVFDKGLEQSIPYDVALPERVPAAKV